MNETTTTTLGNLTITRKTRCNRIDVLPVSGPYGFTFYVCGNCGRDLEVTTTATGFRHLQSFATLDAEVAKG